MNGRQQALTLVVHGALALAIVVAVTVLAALHDLDGQALTALLGAAIGLVGGSAGSLASIGFQGNGTTAPDPAQRAPSTPAP